MELYLVRHAIAAERDPARWPDDGERPLTPEGEARFRVAAKGLKRVIPFVEVVLSSPHARAWRTAEVLTEEAGWPEPIAEKALEAGARVTRVVTALRRRAAEVQSMALVGHEPNLSELAAHLISGSENLAIEVKKGGVVCLALDGAVRANAAWLRWSLSPKILRTLASRAR